MTKALSNIDKSFLFKNFIIFCLFLFPFLAFAQGGPTGLAYECFSGGVYGNCTFNDLVLATRNAINVIIPLAIGFSVVVIAWAGFNYMISGDNAGKRTEANKMLTKVVYGIFFMLAAWMIVNLIASTLVSPSVPRILN